MDRKFSVAIATLMLAAISACDRHADVPASAAATAPVAAAAPAVAASPAEQAQVEALAFIVAIDEQEIAAAEQARGKKIDARIRAYADLLHEEHSANLDQTHALADAARLTLKDDADVAALRTRGQADLERMAALDDDEYAQAYLAAMADGHAEAIALIDERLLPAATRPELRQHLAATRSHVEQHGQSAKQLQTEIPATPKPRPKARPTTVAEPAVAPTPAVSPTPDSPMPEPPISEPPAAPPAAETQAPAGSG